MEASQTKAVPVLFKIVIVAGLIAFVAEQAKILFGHPGIMDTYGFWSGFSAFADVSFRDPITAAGFVDMLVLEITLIVLLCNGLPRGKFYPLILTISILVALVYPGLTALLFLLVYWKRLGQFRP